MASEENEILRVSNKKPLVFLWNHRLVENKNYKDHCWILSKFKEKYPDIPFKILFVCAEAEQNIVKATPEVLKENIHYVGFVSNKAEYQRAIQAANITLATSKLESFGNSVFDSISNGVLLLNLECNDALVTLLGNKYTVSREEMPDMIARAYKSKSFRAEVHQYNLEGMKRIPNVTQHEEALAKRIDTLMISKYERAPRADRSRVVSTALEALAKKTLTKRELYAAVGWLVLKNPLNAHWAGYYYALRREGVRTSFIDGTLYFHCTKNPVVNNSSTYKVQGFGFK